MEYFNTAQQYLTTSITNIYLVVKKQLLCVYNCIFPRLFFIHTYTVGLIIMPLLCIISKPFTNKYDLQFCSWVFCYKILGINHNITNNADIIKEGFILSNHRCGLDLVLSMYMFNASVIGRGMAYLACTCYSILVFFEGRGIYLHRNKDTREIIYNKIKNHMKNDNSSSKLIVFWPEGTRLTYTKLDSIEDVKKNLKYGLLKEIYNDKKYPVQIDISSNKELVFNEKKIKAQYGLTVNTIISSPIYPADFNTFELFIDEISKEWLKCWCFTHEKVQ